MRSRDGIGTRTDAFTQPVASTFEDHEQYRIVRTPSRPDYHWGNYLILDEPPDAGSLETWFDRCREHLRDLPVHKLLLCWESAPGEVWRPARDGTLPEGTHYGRRTVLALHEPPPAATFPPGYTPRILESDDDWHALVALAIAIAGDEIPGCADFTRWSYQQMRERLDGASGAWWGVFRGEGPGAELVASLGLVRTPAALRFQDVQTRADHRGLGLCTALCTHALRETMQPGREIAVIIADAGSQAERIYRKLGFVDVGVEHTLQRNP